MTEAPTPPTTLGHLAELDAYFSGLSYAGVSHAVAAAMVPALLVRSWRSKGTNAIFNTVHGVRLFHTEQVPPKVSLPGS